ncbi:MAG: hypothetical protein LUE11_08545 [Clostridia bacterium]|nr:hypothetical protein [Clostridia bacterium]
MAYMNKVFDLIEDGVHQGYIITSPVTDQDILFDNRWSFNGDFENPTFSPSMLQTYPAENPETGHVREHFFVSNGKIQYLPDCHHDMAGKTVDMITCKWPER